MPSPSPVAIAFFGGATQGRRFAVPLLPVIQSHYEGPHANAKTLILPWTVVPARPENPAKADYSWPNTSPKRKRGSGNELPSLARRANVAHPAPKCPEARIIRTNAEKCHFEWVTFHSQLLDIARVSEFLLMISSSRA